jgi:hypothetical protein
MFFSKKEFLALMKWMGKKNLLGNFFKLNVPRKKDFSREKETKW